MRNNYPYQHSNYGGYQGLCILSKVTAVILQLNHVANYLLKLCLLSMTQLNKIHLLLVKMCLCQWCILVIPQMFIKKIINIYTHSRIQNPLYVRKRINIFVLQAALLDLVLGADSQKSPFILTMKGFYYVKFIMLSSYR